MNQVERKNNLAPGTLLEQNLKRITIQYYIPNIKPLGLMDLDVKMFKVYLTLDVASFDPRAMI